MVTGQYRIGRTRQGRSDDTGAIEKGMTDAELQLVGTFTQPGYFLMVLFVVLDIYKKNLPQELLKPVCMELLSILL